MCIILLCILLALFLELIELRQQSKQIKIVYVTYSFDNVDDGDFAVCRTGILQPGLFRHQCPQLVQIQNRAEDFVLSEMVISHTKLKLNNITTVNLSIKSQLDLSYKYYLWSNNEQCNNTTQFQGPDQQGGSGLSKVKSGPNSLSLISPPNIQGNSGDNIQGESENP